MKLDKIRFARLISYLTEQVFRGSRLTELQIASIDEMIDVEIPEQRAAEASVDELLRQIANPDGFIPAIKAYRALTGVGLKEAKEVIERYRVIPKYRDEHKAVETGPNPSFVRAKISDFQDH